jgi:hypothetical protein
MRFVVVRQEIGAIRGREMLGERGSVRLVVL